MQFEQGQLCIGPARLSWRLGFGKGCKAEEVRYISPEDMSVFTPTATGGIWQNESGLTVTVTYKELDGLLQGQISFSGADTVNDPIEEVIFPRAEMDFDDDTTVLLPVSQGRLLKNLELQCNGIRTEHG